MSELFVRIIAMPGWEPQAPGWGGEVESGRVHASVFVARESHQRWNGAAERQVRAVRGGDIDRWQLEV